MLSCVHSPKATAARVQLLVEGWPPPVRESPHQLSGNLATGMSVVANLLHARHLVSPGWPRLVVMTITPFAASAPYSVPAAAPFTVSMDSMSLTFRSLSRLDGSAPNTPSSASSRSPTPANKARRVVEYRTPSTITTGDDSR